MGSKVRLGDVVSVSKETIRPVEGRIYAHYSLPAFDEGKRPTFEDGADILSNKLLVSNGDILVNKLNVRFKRIWKTDKLPENSVCSTEFVPMRAEKVDRDYLYYLLLDDRFTETMSTMRSGTSSSHQRVKVEWMLDYEVELPEVDAQRKVAKFLTSIDGQIDNLNRTNRHLLELMFGNYHKLFGGLGVNGTVADLGEVVGGATPSKKNEAFFTESGIGWITPKDLSGTSNVFIGHGATDITDAGYDSCSTKLMPKGSVLFSSRAPVGYVAIASNEVCTNQGFKSVVPHPEVGTAYVYCFLKANAGEIEKAGSGTTFIEVSGKAMKSFPAQVPAVEDATEFAAFADPILDAVRNNEAEVKTLTMLRDALLPKLMSGEIDVSKVELLVE